jgi:hypothetical protein
MVELSDRLDAYILGMLLAESVDTPSSPMMNIRQLFNDYSEPNAEELSERINTFTKNKIIYSEIEVDEDGQKEEFIGLTSRGVYFVMENYFFFLENIHGLTMDLPEAISDAIDTIWSFAKTNSPETQNHSRFIELSEKPAAVDQAKEKIEIAINIIKTTNEWNVDKRNLVAEELSQGNTLLSQQKLTIGVIAAAILSPLLSAYNDLAEEGAKASIKAAIDAIKLLIGS